MLQAVHGLAVTLGVSAPAAAAVDRRSRAPGSANARINTTVASKEASEFCNLVAECVRHVQTTVQKLAEVAKEHSMPPRNPVPYVLGYAACGVLVAGLIYYNRATLGPKLRSAASWLRDASTDFTRIHVIEPVKNIYTEIVYRYSSALRTYIHPHRQLLADFAAAL